MKEKFKTLLSIAGSDCIGGAGIQGDSRIAVVLGYHPLTAVTAVTAQNSKGVSEVIPITGKMLLSQLENIFSDVIPDAIKIGITGNTENARIIADFLKSNAEGIPLVIDPIIRASVMGKDSLFMQNSENNELRTIYNSELFPLASVITPNKEEFLFFSGHFESDISSQSIKDFLLQSHVKALIIKSWEQKDERNSDLLAYLIDSMLLKEVKYGQYVKCENLHGTGCTYSSILAICLAEGFNIREAFEYTFNIMHSIINESKSCFLGTSSYGPLNIFSINQKTLSK